MAFIHKFSRSCTDCAFDIITSDVRLCYRSQNTIRHAVVFSKVKTCIQISIERITTMGTLKKTFGTRTNLSALGTDFGSMIRTDLDYFDAFPFSFVSNKLLKLIEAPSVQPKVESSSFSHLSYSFKILQNNSSCIGIIYNLFAYHMVTISHEPFLSARHLLEKSFGRPCAFGLKFTTQSPIFDSFEFNLSCVEELSITCHSNIIYSDINAKNSIMDVRAYGLDIFGKTEQEKTSVLLVNPQQTFTHLPLFEIFSIAIWDFNREFLPSFNSCQTQDIVFDGSRTIEIISHNDMFYYWFCFSSLDKTTSLFNTSYSKLTLQSSFTQGFIYKRLKLNMILNFSFPRLIDTELQSFSINLESSDYFLCCINPNFCCNSNIHHTNKEEESLYKLYAHLSSASNFYIPYNMGKYNRGNKL